MDIKNYKEIVELFLESDNNHFTKSEVNLLSHYFYMMMYHINLLENNEILNKPITVDILSSVVLLISEKILTTGLDLEFRKFIEAYSFIVYNYNNNILKNKNIEILCLLNDMIIKFYSELNNASNMMREIYVHYSDLHNWMPPAFSINKFYLNTLLENNKEE